MNVMIKEVFDFTMYEIGNGGKPVRPVLYSDSLKVSTTEVTAETNEARGGKGNAILLTWDSNKDITVDIEDALFSAKSMAIMFGDGTVKKYGKDNNAFIMKTEIFTATDTTVPVWGTGSDELANAEQKSNKDISGWLPFYTAPGGKMYRKINPKFYAADGTLVAPRSHDGGVAGQLHEFVKDDKYFCTYDLKCEGSIIDVNAASFPGSLATVMRTIEGIKICQNQFGELLEAAA